MRFKSVLLVFTALFSLTAVSAQNSAKSKSKRRDRDKVPEQKVVLKNVVTLNSSSTDYSPVFFQNGLVYVSSRNKNGPRDQKTDETFSELYFSPFDPNGDPSTPQAFSMEMNSILHEGPVTFSRDWNSIFFTRNNMHKGAAKAGRNKVVHLKIYEATRDKVDWSNLKELPFNSENYSCMHPSLSADGKKLYFSSNMPGGFGGYDLYFSEREKNGWSAPKNLGPQINTPKNDVFPFSHCGGDFFFSSDGHEGIGGLDIYVAHLVENASYEVENLGKQFNTANDELGFILNDQGSRGFFSSDRPNGLGKDDIYMFTIESGMQGLEKPESRQVKVLVTDAETGLPLKGVAVRVLEVSSDGFLSGRKDIYDVDLQPVEEKANTMSMKLVRRDANQLGEPDYYSNADGTFMADFYRFKNYMLVVSKEGYKSGDKFYSIEESDEETIHIPLTLAPPEKPVEPVAPVTHASVDKNAPKELTINGPMKEGSKIVIDDIYYETNKSTLNESATKNMDAVARLMQQYPNMEIELISHTDARGDAKSNLDLSNTRAKNAKIYLVFAGINADRIKAYGKGETELRNQCADGVNCSDTDHQYNRRTEIVIKRM